MLILAAVLTIKYVFFDKAENEIADEDTTGDGETTEAIATNEPGIKEGERVVMDFHGIGFQLQRWLCLTVHIHNNISNLLFYPYPSVKKIKIISLTMVIKVFVAAFSLELNFYNKTLNNEIGKIIEEQ